MKTKRSVSGKKHAVREAPGEYENGAIVLYQAPDGGMSIDVRLKEETLWLSLNQISTLFDRDKSVISRHLRNVYQEGELDRGATVAFFATTQTMCFHFGCVKNHEPSLS